MLLTKFIHPSLARQLTSEPEWLVGKEKGAFERLGVSINEDAADVVDGYEDRAADFPAQLQEGVENLLVAEAVGDRQPAAAVARKCRRAPALATDPVDGDAQPPRAAGDAQSAVVQSPAAQSEDQDRRRAVDLRRGASV